MRRALFLATAALLFMTAQAFAVQANDIAGTWINEEGRAKIEIFDCSGHYCGKIVWLKEPNYPADDKLGMGGQPQVDRKNPDPAKRSRQLMGLQIVEDFVYRGDNVWDKGRIYDPKVGKTYQATIKLVSPHRLDLKGYIGIPLFGRTTVWTRWGEEVGIPELLPKVAAELEGADLQQLLDSVLPLFTRKPK